MSESGSTSGRRARGRRTPSPRARTGAAGWHGDQIATLGSALRQLRDYLRATRFGLAMPVADEAARQSQALAAQLDDYVLPRIARLDAPLLVVVGGSTGAGKSTLVNSLLRAPVSPAGVLRPTTRSPVLVCNPDDVRWFGEAHLLPDIPRAGAGVDGPRLQLVTAPDLPPGVAFLDAPDIDSVVDANRDLAGQLLAAADLWLFLTTASRYADAVPWDVLRDAEERGTAVALVLDRVPEQGAEVIIGHLQQMLVDNGFSGAPLFVVPEQPLDNQGLLPEETIGPIRDWFGRLANDAEHRDAVVRQTLSGTVASIQQRVEAIAVQADAQRDAAMALRTTAQHAYSEALSRVEEGLSDGALLRGEVLARWQELVGSGDLTRALEARVGKLRDQVRAAITGRPLPGRKFQAALTSGTAALISASAADAAEQTAVQWSTHPAGRALLEAGISDPAPDGDTDAGHPDPMQYHRASPDLEERAEKLVKDWQRWVLDLVRKEAGNKRSVARMTAYTVNATGLLVMVGVFASTAFIPTGAEIAVAGGTTVASQKLLEAIFGDQAVRTLAARARQDLLDRVRVLLDDERQRYTDLLHDAGVDPAAPDRLRAAAGDVERARIAAGLVPTRDALAAIPLMPEQPESADPEASDDAPETDAPETADQPAEEALDTTAEPTDATPDATTRPTGPSGPEHEGGESGHVQHAPDSPDPGDTGGDSPGTTGPGLEGPAPAGPGPDTGTSHPDPDHPDAPNPGPENSGVDRGSAAADTDVEADPAPEQTTDSGVATGTLTSTKKRPQKKSRGTAAKPGGKARTTKNRGTKTKKRAGEATPAKRAAEPTTGAGDTSTNNAAADNASGSSSKRDTPQPTTEGTGTSSGKGGSERTVSRTPKTSRRKR